MSIQKNGYFPSEGPVLACVTAWPCIFEVLNDFMLSRCGDDAALPLGGGEGVSGWMLGAVTAGPAVCQDVSSSFWVFWTACSIQSSHAQQVGSWKRFIIAFGCECPSSPCFIVFVLWLLIRCEMSVCVCCVTGNDLVSLENTWCAMWNLNDWCLCGSSSDAEHVCLQIAKPEVFCRQDRFESDVLLDVMSETSV